MFVIPTLQAEHLAQRMQRKGARVLYPGVNKEGRRHFPDGELYVRIPRARELRAHRVLVVHAGSPLPNEGLVELSLLLQILRETKPSRVDVLFSYFPYGMQDSAFRKGETNVAEALIEKLVRYDRVKRIFLIDPHFALESWTARYPLHILSAVPLLIASSRSDFGEHTLFLSPDKGGKRRTKIQGTAKKRKNSFEVEIQSSSRLQKTIRDRPVAVVDDLIETGGTLVRFYEECKMAGASKVAALVTHGVLPSGIERVKKKYDKLYLTNTVSREESNVDITPLILQTL